MKSPRTVCVSKRTSVLGMRNAAKYLCAGTNILKNCQTLGTLFEQQQHRVEQNNNNVLRSTLLRSRI